MGLGEVTVDLERIGELDGRLLELALVGIAFAAFEVPLLSAYWDRDDNPRSDQAQAIQSRLLRPDVWPRLVKFSLPIPSNIFSTNSRCSVLRF